MKKTSPIQIVISVVFVITIFGCAFNNGFIPPANETVEGVNLVKTPTNTKVPIPTVMIAQPSPTAFRLEPNPFPEQGELSDRDFVHQLLQTNGGCKLPCWWGIVPGETQWDETEQFLLDLSLKIELTREETTTKEDGTSSRDRVFHIYIDNAKTQILELSASDNLVTGIRMSSPLTDYHYLLKDLLNNQGAPDKIFIFTHSNVMESPTAFDLFLYYQEQHFLAAYTTLVYKENEQITACLDDVGPDLIIFRENEYLSDQQIQEIFLGPDPLGVLSVDDAIGMSPTVFYETYRNSETSCLVTPANIWP